MGMMTRLILIFILTAVFMTALSSCGGKDSHTDKISTTQKTDLVVFSPHPAEKTEAIIREFRQRTNLVVREVHGGTAELLFRLKGCVEIADVFWGGGVESLESAKELFQPYESSQSAYITPSSMDAEHLWTGFSLMTMVIVYNSALVKTQDAPDSWNDLKSPFFSSRVFIPDPEKSGSAYSMLNAILLTAEDGNWDLLGAIKQQAASGGVASNAPLVHTAVASGEYFAGLTSEDSALAYLQQNTGSPLSIVYPADGTVSVPDGVALVKGCVNENAAKEFIDFVLSKGVQATVVHDWMRRSVRNDVSLPDKAREVSDIKILSYNIYDAAKNREIFLEHWRQL